MSVGAAGVDVGLRSPGDWNLRVLVLHRIDFRRPVCAARGVGGGASPQFHKVRLSKTSMDIRITSADPRFALLHRSRNLRWDGNPAEAAAEVALCSTAEQAAEALQRVVNAGTRPTIRSGGHCYEDFVVNNPGGAILDLSLLKSDTLPGDGNRYRISPGQELGEAYISLYKRHGVTIPGGSCYEVGAGGHITGGGYGVLSRLHGLTVDWLSAVEILTVDNKGHVALKRVDEQHDPDLFRACRGGGGGNFGVVTGFLFDRLPTAPFEVVNAHISFDWRGMTEDNFVGIVQAFGDYFAKRGCQSDTWGLFAGLGLTHASSGRMGLSLQFCNPDGRCDDLKPVEEFLDRFQDFAPAGGRVAMPGDQRFASRTPTARQQTGNYNFERMMWLDATIGGSGGEHSGRAAYKSCYMKKNFTVAEAKCIYKHLTRTVPGVDLRGSVMAVDSYGGAVNAKGKAEVTSVWQRASILKVQFQQYWENAEEDSGRLQWMREFYTDLYSQEVEQKYAGTPYPNECYEGCYINYPDSDLLQYPFWPQVYYGTQDLYPFLQQVKRRYDPNNIFHHKMSIRA
jgi:FAD binding domain/Berberine and berberine like